VLAASTGIPMLVALGARARSVPDGATVILDAEAGRLDVDPDTNALANAQQRLSAHRTDRADARARAGADACTRDGTRIEVFANLGSVDDAARAVAEGAEGCGLLRTEFLFLGRDVAPSEDEQADIYGRIAAALGDRFLRVPVASVAAVKGTSRVRGLNLRSSDGERTIDVEVVATALPGAPSFEVAAQAGARLRFDPPTGYAVSCDARGRCDAPYLAAATDVPVAAGASGASISGAWAASCR
jgi:hypothetical protein